jgi:hypothetical protein
MMPVVRPREEAVMSLQIQRVQVWSGEIADLLGTAAGKLEHLTAAGVRLEYVCTFPHPSDATRGILFLAPITGPEQMQAARDAGLGPALDVAMLHVQGEPGPDRGLDLMSRLAVAGVHLHGMALRTSSDRFDAFLAFPSADVAARAVQVLATLEQ